MSKFIPQKFQQYIDYIQMQPSSVDGLNNFSVLVNKRYLYNLIYSVFDLEIPKNWNRSYYRYFLFHEGNLGVFYTKKFGCCKLYVLVFFRENSPHSVTKKDESHCFLKIFSLPPLSKRKNQYIVYPQALFSVYYEKKRETHEQYKKEHKSE